MKITEQDLKNISLLSKIKIDEETSDSLVKDLESILILLNKEMFLRSCSVIFIIMIKREEDFIST